MYLINGTPDNLNELQREKLSVPQIWDLDSTPPLISVSECPER